MNTYYSVSYLDVVTTQTFYGVLDEDKIANLFLSDRVQIQTLSGPESREWYKQNGRFIGVKEVMV